MTQMKWFDFSTLLKTGLFKELFCWICSVYTGVQWLVD